jgi:hypothetical protein
MAISAAYENSATIGTTLYSLPNNSTSLTPITVDGVYQVFVDFSSMTVTEEYEVTIYEKVTAGGSQVELHQAVVSGTSVRGLVFPSVTLMHGWDVQVRKLSGTDRSIGWSIRQVA